MDKKNKIRNKGITIISLVVTIIIVIILAGVSITVMLDNNIIGKAQGAKLQDKIAKAQEMLQQALLNATYRNGR